MLNEMGVVMDEARARATAVAVRTAVITIDDEEGMFEYGEDRDWLSEGMAASRRCAIAFFFERS